MTEMEDDFFEKTEFFKKNVGAKNKKLKEATLVNEELDVWERRGWCVE